MKIEFTKKVVFKDREGTVLRTFEVGDVYSAEGVAGRPGAKYFITGMGGIYLDEAKEI